MKRAAAALLLVLGPGCGDDPPRPVTPPRDAGAPCSPGELAEDGGACIPAGLPAEAAPCAAGEVELERGGCEPAGVPEAACAEGFEPDGERGCAPVLAAPCPEGKMAVPGDASCREIAPCGSAPWGDIPVEPGTQYVDASYAGTDSDGSEAKPWTKITPALGAVPEGGMVAIAAGSYAEAITLLSKSVRVWGRCPAMVEILGGGFWPAALTLGSGATNAEVHALALTGKGWGISQSGATGTLVDRVWIHDTGESGVDIDATLGPPELTIRGSLIEHAPVGAYAREDSRLTLEGSVVRAIATAGSYTVGVWLAPTSKVTIRRSVVESVAGIGALSQGGALEIDGSVLRALESAPDGSLGRAISIQPAETSRARPTLRLTRSLVTQARELAVSIASGDAVIDATVIRDTKPLGDGTLGVGLGAGPSRGSAPSTLELTRSVLAANPGAGATVLGAEATVVGLLVRDTPRSPGSDLPAIGIEFTDGATATMSGSVITRSADIGLNVSGAKLALDATVVEDSGTDALDGSRGINVQSTKDGSARSDVTIRASRFDRNRKYGIRAGASDLLVESTVVSGTLGSDATTTAAGIQVQNFSGGGQRGVATIRSSLVQGNVESGIAVFGSDLVVEGTAVLGTLPRETVLGAGNGRGVFGFDNHGEASNLVVRGSVVAHGPAFGIGVIGSTATVEGTRVEDTRVRADGRYGDGLTVSSSALPGSLTVHSSLVLTSGRAGASNFGGHLAVGTVVLECNAIDLDGEPVGDAEPTFDDTGGNVCGCNGAELACAVQSASLQPPEAPAVPDE